MIYLTFSIAVLDRHARLTRLETGAPVLAAVGTADNVGLVQLASSGGNKPRGRIETDPDPFSRQVVLLQSQSALGRAPPSFTSSVARLSNAVNNIATAAVGLLSRNRRDWISGGGVVVPP